MQRMRRPHCLAENGDQDPLLRLIIPLHSLLNNRLLEIHSVLHQFYRRQLHRLLLKALKIPLKMRILGLSQVSTLRQEPAEISEEIVPPTLVLAGTY